jgi:hypothetical protein
MKRLLDLTSRNIDVGQVAQHLFLQYLFFHVFFFNIIKIYMYIFRVKPHIGYILLRHYRCLTFLCVAFY